jgi:hypothetical protein
MIFSILPATKPIRTHSIFAFAWLSCYGNPNFLLPTVAGSYVFILEGLVVSRRFCLGRCRRHKRADTFAGDCQTDDRVHVGAGFPRPDPHSDVRLENDRAETSGLNDAESQIGSALVRVKTIQKERYRMKTSRAKPGRGNRGAETAPLRECETLKMGFPIGERKSFAKKQRFFPPAL